MTSDGVHTAGRLETAVMTLDVGMFMGMFSRKGLVLYLVESDAEPHGLGAGFGRAGLVGREPLIHALQKGLAFFIQQL